jgi:hypothetical protein
MSNPSLSMSTQMQLREAQFQLKYPTEDSVSNTFNNLAHPPVKKEPEKLACCNDNIK